MSIEVSEARRRRLGSYYTPDDVADILVEWALVDNVGPVLDPSFGRCAFALAASRYLSRCSSGRGSTGALVFGVDLDATCRAAVPSIEGLLPENFLCRDFIGVLPGDAGWPLFNAVVGNPPFVRHHWMTNGQKEAVRHVITGSRTGLSLRSSLWAVFVIHALRFLRPSGRLAMLVPEAILQTDYGREIQDVLRRRFRKVWLVRLQERLFDETPERVVVVLGRGEGPGELTVGQVNDVDGLKTFLERGSRSDEMPLLSSANEKVLERAASLPAINLMDQLAEVRIGVVTGKNDFFVVNTAVIKTRGLADDEAVPIVPRTRFLSGLTFSARDLRALVDDGKPVFLIKPGDACRSPGWDALVAEGEATGVHLGFKCQDRAPWFEVPLGLVPDAFATCSRGSAPKLVLNAAGARCTNALHAVWWKSGVAPRAAVVGFMTSLTAAAAESTGRRYGGGVLKIEPGLLKRLPIPVVAGAGRILPELDRLVRAGREPEARVVADRVVLEEGLGLSQRDVAALRQLANDLASERTNFPSAS